MPQRDASTMTTGSNTAPTDWPSTTRPTPIGHGAAEHLRYIRSTIEATQTFTAVPGSGCIAMGLVGFGAAAVERVPGLEGQWFAIWLGAAALAGALALGFMEVKAHRLGLSLRRAVAARFFMTLIPAFTAGGVLTLALLDLVGRDVIAALWLMLYGVGLAACGLFSVPAVLKAGIGFLALGTVALLLPAGAAPWLLAAGFGGIHVGLGIVIRRYHGG